MKLRGQFRAASSEGKETKRGGKGKEETLERNGRKIP